MLRGLLLFTIFAALQADKLLVPMDLSQSDHLRAYGVAYRAISKGLDVEWLLNFRGGSFMMEYDRNIEKDCAVNSVRWEHVSASDVLEIYQTIEENNMETVLLEKAPRIAVYIPENFEPWDDAVTLALEYAGIPYEQVWDDDVLNGVLPKYDWLHLHHEDFTGQYGKFYGSQRQTEWYQAEVRMNEEICHRLGFAKVSRMKLAVALAIKAYISEGGFVFSMCSACDTYEIALAAAETDICHGIYDGDPFDQQANKKLDFSLCLAFEKFQVVLDPLVYEHSTIDVMQESSRRGPNTYVSLFEFSAKFDPVPSMLVQNHTALVKEFLGQCSGFRRSTIKVAVLNLGEVVGTEEVKYLHGDYGKGTFTYLAGHDPEDYQHFVGDPPTDLGLHRNSPGYRLILNNVLFPAARKKELKT
ncbi:MAG: asparagine synthetase B [candidate division WOR-3 bacterium]|nr:asparagine synthetase B [candidate division WOR-3 bacterium]